MVTLSYFPLKNRTPLTYLSFSMDLFKAFKFFFFKKLIAIELKVATI